MTHPDFPKLVGSLGFRVLGFGFWVLGLGFGAVNTNCFIGGM